ncbi:hypothetical protein [Nitrolancea hollandica]|uniref:Uncharacterized protein n=1 Tax=Nitrolancea hollandica Lb TaxID=1129897 RepID=I4EKF7_9BACT|nr:hypothetical protein [Nitrolancea hollandica]CCF85169.1 hypothetical protein NITHO_460005 [Nitrolancea hollandica Lb]
MKKPRLDAFDPKHADKMAESFAHLPPILPTDKREPEEPKAEPHHEDSVQQASPSVQSREKPVQREPKLPMLPEEDGETVLFDLRHTGTEQRSIRFTLAEKRALEDLAMLLEREYGITTDVTHLLRAGAHIILANWQRTDDKRDLSLIVRYLRDGIL